MTSYEKISSLPGGMHEESGIHIRQATASDVPFIQEIARKTWRDTYEGVITEKAQDDVLKDAYSDEALAKSICDHRAFLVAETSHSNNKKLCGYIDVDYDGKNINLYRLYILPEYQHRGLGKRLLETSLSWVLKQLPEDIKDSIYVVAQVEEDNLKARAFYKKMGFSENHRETVIIGGVALPVIAISMKLDVR